MRPRRTEALLLAIGLCLAGGAAARTVADWQLMEVWLNGQHVDSFAPLVQIDGQWHAAADDLRRWRLQPDGAGQRMHGKTVHPLQGWQPVLDPATQRLQLQAPVDAFVPQALRVGGDTSDTPLTRASPGLALDHMVNLDHDGDGTRAAALLELRGFGGPGGGVLHHSGVLRAGGLMPTEGRWLRLDTAWRHHDPQTLRRTTVGDSLSCGGELAPAMRFAGLQSQTDFGLRPDLITHPLPGVRGSATVPSGIDLLVNRQPVGSVNVGPGAFSLESLPTVTGAGEIQLVQRDLLGVEQVRSVPYYISPRLLRPGLSDQCAEAGVLRRNHGLASADYRDGFAAYALRHGLDERFTLLGRVALGARVRSLHLGLHALPGSASPLGVFSAQLSHSQTDEAGSGHSARLRFERVDRQRSIGAAIEHADPRFRQEDGSRPPARRASLFTGWTTGATSWSAGTVWQRGAAPGVMPGMPTMATTPPTTRVLTAGVQRRLPMGWQAGLSALRRNGDWAAALILTRSLGPATSVATRLQTGASAGLAVEAQQTEPAAGGAGWRVQAGGGQADAQAGVSWLGDAGRAELQAARLASDGRVVWRATAHGGLLWLGGAPRASRALGDGAAVQVLLEDMPGVRVLLNHRDTAVTDAQGRAWLHNLQPWEDNTIAIAVDGLPMDLALSTPELRVRPPAASVVQVRFPAWRSRNAVVVLVDVTGQPIEAGSRAQWAGDAVGAGAPVARGGQVFLQGLGDTNEVRVSGPHGRCRAHFALDAGALLQPVIGPLTCHAEARP